MKKKKCRIRYPTDNKPMVFVKLKSGNFLRIRSGPTSPCVFNEDGTKKTGYLKSYMAVIEEAIGVSIKDCIEVLKMFRNENERKKILDYSITFTKEFYEGIEVTGIEVEFTRFSKKLDN